MIKDMYDNPLEIGDKVVYTYKTSTTIYSGIISGFTKSGKTALLECKDGIRKIRSSLLVNLKFI